MRIHFLLSVVSFAVFLLPWAAQPRVLPSLIIDNCAEPGCIDAQNSWSPLQNSHTPLRASGRINLLINEHAGATFLDAHSASIPHAPKDKFGKRAAIKLPKVKKPDSDTPNSDQGDSGGFVPGLAKSSDTNEPESGDSGGFSPGLSTTKEDTGDAESEELCKRSIAGLWPRADCQPGSGDDEPGGGGFDSEPPEFPTPGFDRRIVQNWYDIVEQSPKPPLRANDQLDRRLNSEEPDQPVAEFSGRYNLRSSVELLGMFSNTRFGIGEMHKTLGRGESGPGVSWSLKSSKTGGGNFHQATFSSDGSIVIADYSQKVKDMNSPADQVPWNQLSFKEYKDVMNGRNGGNLLNLEVIGRREITLSEVATFRAQAVPGSEEAKAFEALCRTDNINGILYLLSDYHQALGNKRITNIHIATEDRLTYDMVIDIA